MGSFNIIKKLLIVNRGEIAYRIILTARKMNIYTIALYTQNERDKRYVQLANEAYLLEGTSPSETFLNVNQIISIARMSGANAIHPGYGFLAENFSFAQLVIDNGFIWIGPSPKVLKLLSDKIEATKLAQLLGIPTIPYFFGTASELIHYSFNQPFPLLIKAAAGGGGKGMKVVENVDQINDAIASASREALAYFGDDRLFITPYFPMVRHVEVQVLGDKHGNVFHFYDRDCTVQRRHQKIIEEAPAVSLHSPIRDKIIRDAVKLLQHARYDNVGTVEFIVLPDERYFFLEVNTRIQVEHPVTEMITGYDIVEFQILSAIGEKLPFNQDDIQVNGHAIECRICAEDVENNCLPSTGKIEFIQFPYLANVRYDTDIETNSAVDAMYDSLLAKVIAWGKDRNEARELLTYVLEHIVIHGIRNNLNVLYQILTDHKFIKNRLYTNYLNEQIGIIQHKIKQKANSIHSENIAITAAVVFLLQRNASVKNVWNLLGYWRIMPVLSISIYQQDYVLFVDKIRYKHVNILINGNLYTIKINQNTHHAINITICNNSNEIVEIMGYYTVSSNGKIYLNINTISIEAIIFNHMYDDRFSFKQISDSNNFGNAIYQIKAPLPGKIIQITPAVGEIVEAGELLAIIESMKTENKIFAHRTIKIKQIHIREGQVVSLNQPLFSLEDI